MSTKAKRPYPLLFSWLDVKLGGRMLARYPGFTIIATLALAVAIALGASYFEVLNKWKNPGLRVPDADRLVALTLWDAKAHRTEGRALPDFAIWRRQLTTIDHLGAAILFDRNLTTADGQVESVRGAELSATAFQLMGTRPLAGRTLTAQDEDPGQPPVVVIGERIWKTRFDSALDVVGRSVRVGSVTATIIGVMPESFGFPEAQRLWLPLRANGSLFAPRTGPTVWVFGRLAPGASMESAQAELSAVAAGMAATNPESRRDLQAFVAPYAEPPKRGEGRFLTGLLYAVNTIALLLLGVISMNVATLVFARTATRGWEITVRSALGAARGRIISQLFIEALVLAGVAAVGGLFLAKLAMRWGVAFMSSIVPMPFWVNDSLSWKTVLYGGVLAVFGAAIVGVLPALRVTRVNVVEAMRREGVSGSGLRFGGFWTAVIVFQVAFTVAFLPLAVGGIAKSNRFADRAQAIGADRYLTAGIAMDREDYVSDSSAAATRARVSGEKLEQRLRAKPGVEQVAFADRLPVADPLKYGLQVDTTRGAPPLGLRASTGTNVSSGFFAAFGTSVISGRDFTPLDFEADRHVMIVNASFVRHVFGGRNAIGQRVRISGDPDETTAAPEWYEIIGVVNDFGWKPERPTDQAAMYLASPPISGRARQLAVRVRNPEAFAARLRALAVEVDPALRLTDIKLLSSTGSTEAAINWTLTAVGWLIAIIVLLLSTTGIHALMSFTVARRTREIGIRTALGAPRRRIVTAIFTRAFLQIGIGLVIGSTLAGLIGLGSSRALQFLLLADGIMLVAGMTACALPLRRALRIDPTEALRAGG